MHKYERYQDYVIKDGKFIGEFEEMYRAFEDPWEQTTREINTFEKLIGIELLKRDGISNPLEYGCGFGDYTERLRKSCRNASGVDISTTAIEKAKLRHPKCNFYVGDILDSKILDIVKPDAILFIEISWYVLEKLVPFKALLKNKFGGSGTKFLHNLMTYAPGTQRYGTDYFTNLTEIISFWSDIIVVQDWGSISNSEYHGGARTFLYGEII
jgi:hypothetical protein